MKDQIFYSAGDTQALKYAAVALEQSGCLFALEPDASVTHLLLDVPHKNWACLPAILERLSPDVTIVGGNLSHPSLTNYKTVDLLQDAIYLAQNAGITAHCAVKLALHQSPVTLDRCPVLVVGWGRIGKCLSRLLKQMGASVTVAARKETDRGMLMALGYDTMDIKALDNGLSGYRMIFNTVPVAILSQEAMGCCRADCLKLELASLPGMAGEDIICARGLPNRGAPESSGELIARSILRLC